MQSFANDVAFLKKYTPVIVLRRNATQIALAPAWQGRVMTSTADAASNHSYGWINREFIASRKVQPHINAFGGEDRVWLGPEGGQYSIFFQKHAPFDLDHWFVPPALDTEPFEVTRQSDSEAEFRSHFSVINYSGTRFDVHIERLVRLLEPKDIWPRLGPVPSQNVRLVAFESRNKVINAGSAAWKKESGLLSIWIAGMFPPSASATVVIPIRSGPESQLGAHVTSEYFGTIPAKQLAVANDAIFFRGNGTFRSKIGISPRRSLGKMGSYDAEHQVLTIIQFSQPPDTVDYVNSLWKLQDEPFAGDAANSYNDGPPTPGAKPLGPFYEMESSSPAAALVPGGSLEHVHLTSHLIGTECELDALSRAALDIPLKRIQSAF